MAALSVGLQEKLESDTGDHPPQRGEPPQRSEALVLGITRDTLGLLYKGLASYWQMLRSARSWSERLLAYSPILLVLYMAVAFSGLVKT